MRGLMRYTTLAPVFAHLNLAVSQAGADARGSMLSQLGEYTSRIVGPLNMRPTAAALVAAEHDRVEVRVSSAGNHVLVVLAAADALAGEVFVLRSLAQKRLPAPRLIAHDLSCGVVPHAWTVLSHVSGTPLAAVVDDALLRLGARQLGRALRRLHQLPAPGFGQPRASGRWQTRSWREVLSIWLARRDARQRAVDVLGAERAAALWTATVEHSLLECHEPRALHGAPGPEHALVTGADASMHLEALVRPGSIVAGDPLFDLAYGLLPRYPQTFRHGLVEGYLASGPLGSGQEQRLARLRLLIHSVETLYRGPAWELSVLAGQVDAELVRLGGSAAPL
jgi:hypothetical protein